jgi:UbiD family decarboxylase
MDPETGNTNVGCRRLSLRNPREAGINATAPSDLKRINSKVAARGQRLPVSFAIGSHLVNFMAATMRIPTDEITLLARLRGEPLPLVKCVTNDSGRILGRTDSGNERPAGRSDGDEGVARGHQRPVAAHF